MQNFDEAREMLTAAALAVAHASSEVLAAGEVADDGSVTIAASDEYLRALLKSWNDAGEVSLAALSASRKGGGQ